MEDQVFGEQPNASLLHDMRDSILRLVTAPRSGTAVTYERVGEQRALAIGAALNALFALGMGFGLFRLQQGLIGLVTFGYAGPGFMDFVKMFFVGLAPAVGIIAASHLARRMAGCPDLSPGYDVLLSGLALLPSGLWLSLAGLLGPGAYVLILGIGVISVSSTVLILCGGFDAKQTRMSETRATLCVPLTLLAGAIMTRIAVSVVLGF